jgi:hypothetical protein
MCGEQVRSEDKRWMEKWVVGWVSSTKCGWVFTMDKVVGVSGVMRRRKRRGTDRGV